MVRALTETGLDGRIVEIKLDGKDTDEDEDRPIMPETFAADRAAPVVVALDNTPALNAETGMIENVNTVTTNGGITFVVIEALALEPVAAVNPKTLAPPQRTSNQSARLQSISDTFRLLHVSHSEQPPG